MNLFAVCITYMYIYTSWESEVAKMLGTQKHPKVFQNGQVLQTIDPDIVLIGLDLVLILSPLTILKQVCMVLYHDL